MCTDLRTRFLLCAVVVCFHLDVSLSLSDGSDEQVSDMLHELKQGGLTVVKWSSVYDEQHRLFSSRRARRMSVAAEDNLTVPETRAQRQEREAADFFISSGEDPTCESNSTLCTGPGQECQGTDLCVCRDDFDGSPAANQSCTLIPESRKLYLTITLEYRYNSSLQNPNSSESFLHKVYVGTDLVPFFQRVSGYKTLKVVEFRNISANTQVVVSLFFTTNVLSGQILEVAKAVLTMEANGLTVNISGTPVKQSGLTGIFANYSDTNQSAVDAVDWCSNSTLHKCPSGRDCVDFGVDPRYKCECRSGTESDECEGDVLTENNNQLVIGLAVGIPLAVILSATVAIGAGLHIRARIKAKNRIQIGDSPS